jgi:hypothetical protein
MTPLLILLFLECVIVVIALVCARGRAVLAALALLCFTAPLEVYRTPLFDYNVSLFRLSLLLALLVVCYGMRPVLLSLASRFVPLVYLALVIVMVVSLLTLSENTFLGFRLVGQAFLGLVALLVVATLVTALSIETFARFFLAGAIVPLITASAQGILPVLNIPPELPLLEHLPAAAGLERTRDDVAFAREQGVRAKGTFGDPNHFGVYALVVTVVAAGLTLQAMAPQQVLVTVRFAAMTFAGAALMIAAYSRTAFLGALVASIVLGGLLRARLAQSRRLAVPLVALGALGFILILPLTPRIVDRFNPAYADNAVSNRGHVRTARFAMDTYANNPGLGVGVSDLGPMLEQGVRTSGAHSSYLTVAAELGTLGLILIIAIGLGVLTALYRAHSRSPLDGHVSASLVAAYAGFLATNLTYDVWWDDFHFALAGVALACTARLPPGFRRGHMTSRGECCPDTGRSG